MRKVKGRHPLSWFLFTVILLTSFGHVAAQQENRADLILHNGVVWTGETGMPRAEAIATSGNRILAAGKNESVLKYREPSTRVIDLEGAFVTPGFNDSHVHFASAARFFWNLQLMDVHEDGPFVDRVRAYVREHPGEPIRGGGWGAYEQWRAGASRGEGKTETWLPDRRLIDELTGNTPLFIARFDNSTYFANTAAMRNAGIAETDADPAGVTFVRDAGGRITGAIRFDSRRTARTWTPRFLGGELEPDFQKRLAMSRNALRIIREAGVTTVQDMSDHDQLHVYNRLLDDGDLTSRIHFRYGLQYWKEMRELGVTRGAGNAMIRLGAVKGHIDGIMGTSSARFYEPYDSDPEGKNRGRWRPLTWVSPEQPTVLNRGPFTEMMIAADAADVQVTVHAIGDEANGVMLDMIEAMTRANGARDRRMRLVHAQVLAPDDFARLRPLGVIAEVQPYHLSDDMRWMEERIGHKRCRGAYAFRTLQQSGATLCFGSDWPGTTAAYYPVDPVYGLYAAVTRQTVRGEPEDGWFRDERITIEEALRAYTWGPAFATFEEDIKGTLKPGKLADITVLDTNLLNTDPDTWLHPDGRMKVRVLYTIVDGNVVYENEDGR